MQPFWEIMDRLAKKVSPYVPFTITNTVGRNVDKKYKTVLDIGCGEGIPMALINKHGGFHAVGLDIHGPSLNQAKKAGYHDDLILCNVQKLPIKRKSFDVAICVEVIEHLRKDEGWKLLEEMEEIARSQLVISTPVEWPFETSPGDPYGHRATWSPADFKKRGYNLRGIGLRGVRMSAKGINGLWPSLPRPFRPLCYIVWVLAGPFVWFFPRLADFMVATKNISG